MVTVREILERKDKSVSKADLKRREVKMVKSFKEFLRANNTPDQVFVVGVIDSDD